MEQHNFLQGTPEWHAHRARSKNASEAAMALGCSSYMTRTQLLYALHTGIRPEVSPIQQRIFAEGHEIEAAQRPLAEEFIGEDLFPVVGTAEVDGVLLSASFDGLTMAEDTGYECKTLNEELRAALPHNDPEHNDPAALPKMYRVQMEQQLAVCGGERVLFVAATLDGSDVRRCWYYSDLALRREIIGGWKQLDADLAVYTPPAAAAPKLAAEPVEALPAPIIQVTGQLALKDNFQVFEDRLRHFLEHRLIREPKTDQDFADLDAQIKAMKQARESLKAAGAQMLAQVAPVEQATKKQEMLDKLLQQNVSVAETLLKHEKERRKGDIVAGAVKALADHVAALNLRLGRPYMPAVPADFGGVIRGLKSLASMEDKVATELARAKIAANEIEARISFNLTMLRDQAAEVPHLFPDTATIVLKAPDDLQSLVTARIAEHRAAEERRLEAERARIRAEEQAKLQREQEAAARRQREEDAANAAAQALAESRKAQALPEQLQNDLEQAAAGLVADLAVSRAAEAAKPPAANVVPMPTKAPAPVSSTPTLKLGDINARLGVISVTAEGLARLGFPVIATDRGAKLYRESDWIAMVDAITAHLEDNVRAGVHGVAA